MKNVKKTAMTGLAAVLATSAVVPAAVASAENTATTALKEVVLQLTDGSKVQVDYDAYKAAKTAEIEWAETAKVIGTVGSDKVTYDIKDFIEAKTAAEGDLAETLELLTNNKKPAELNDVKPAEVKDGELVIGDETPSEETIAVESVKAINDVAVEVTFGEGAELTEADVEGKTITLTDAEGNKITATYVPGSFGNGKAEFKLEDDKALVDAGKYSVSADWADIKGSEFVAETQTAYVASFEKVTTDVTAKKYVAEDEGKKVEESGVTTVVVEAKDQYGKEIAAPATVSELKVTVNGMPLTGIEANYADGKVTIKKTLAESDKVAIQLVTKKADKVVADSTLEYTVVKGEEAKATTIDLKADKTTVPFGKEIKFTAEVLDQYNSPFEDTLRWVVNGEKVDGNDNEYTLPATTEAGEYKVQVFSVADSKVQAEMTVTVGAAELGELTLTKKQDAFNNEESIVGYLTANEGAVIVPENVTFEIDAASKDVKPEDIKVKAEKVTEKVEGKEVESIAVKATSTKPGSYKIVAKVDEVKSSPITVETTINPEVADFTVTPVKENEVTLGGKVEKVVTFKNKHGETVVPAPTAVKITSSNEEIATATATTKKVNKDDKEESFVVTFTGVKAGDVTFTFVAGKVAKQVSFEVVKTAGIDSINLGATIGKGLIAGTGQEEFVRPITIKDQYGNDYVPTAEEFGKLKANIVTEAADVKNKATAALKFYKVDEKTGDIVTKVDGSDVLKADAKGVALVLDATSAENTKDESVKVTVSKGEDDKAEVLATVNATVQAVSKLKSVTVDAKQTTMTTGGSVEVLVVPVDQYGKVVKSATIALNDTENKVAIEGSPTAVYVDKDGKEVVEDTEGAILKGYKVTVKGEEKGETTAEFVASTGAEKTLVEAKVKQAFKVDAVGNLVDKVEIEKVEEVNNSGEATEVQLKATGLDKDGKEVVIADEDLTWSIKSVKDEKGNVLTVEDEGKLSYAKDVEDKNKALTADQLNNAKAELNEKTGKLEVSAGITVEVEAEVRTANNKKATTTVKYNAEPAKYVSGATVATVNGVYAKDVEGNGLKITFDSLNDEKEIDDITLTFTGVNQYGKTFPIGEGTKVVATSGDKDVVTADFTAATLTLKAVGAGTAKVFVVVGDNEDEVVIDVTVTDEVIAAQQAAKEKLDAAKQELTTAIGEAKAKIDSNKEYKATELATFNEAITAAEKALNDKDATVESLTTAQSTLKGATKDAPAEKADAVIPEIQSITTTDAKTFTITGELGSATVTVNDKKVENGTVTFAQAVQTGGELTVVINVPATGENKAGTKEITYTVTSETSGEPETTTWTVTEKQ